MSPLEWGLEDRDHACPLSIGIWGICVCPLPPRGGGLRSRHGHTRCCLAGRRATRVVASGGGRGCRYPVSSCLGAKWDGATRGGMEGVGPHGSFLCDGQGQGGMRPCVPRPQGNRGAGLLVSPTCLGDGAQGEMGEHVPAFLGHPPAWRTRRLRPLTSLPAWRTEGGGPGDVRGQGGMGSCMSSPAGCDGATHIPACEGAGPRERGGWDYAWAQDTVGTPWGSLMSHPGRESGCALWWHRAIWPQGRPQAGKLETQLVPGCMLAIACAQLWDFLDDV